MAEVLLFHHAHGLTAGVIEFADDLRRAGHTVHTPDLYQGQTFDDLEAGVAHAERIGFNVIIDRAVAAAADLPEGLVYAGMSLGVLPAQKLTQTRPGAKGGLLIDACVPPSEFGSTWPEAVPLQVHGMEADKLFVGDGDIEVARKLVDGRDDRQLFLYAGDRHLFADRSLPSHNKTAADILTQRILDFLAAATRDQA